MRKQGASAQQAAWEEQRKKREELESRMSMNKVRCISGFTAKRRAVSRGQQLRVP